MSSDIRFIAEVPCTGCNGTGVKPHWRDAYREIICRGCNGTRWMQKHLTITELKKLLGIEDKG